MSEISYMPDELNEHYPPPQHPHGLRAAVRKECMHERANDAFSVLYSHLSYQVAIRIPSWPSASPLADPRTVCADKTKTLARHSSLLHVRRVRVRSAAART